MNTFLTQTYDGMIASLNDLMNTFQDVAIEHYSELIQEILGEKTGIVNISRLNEKIPQLHVYSKNTIMTVTAFNAYGMFYADSSYSNDEELFIDNDLSLEGIQNTIFYLRNLIKEIQSGTVIKTRSEEYNQIYLEYKSINQ